METALSTLQELSGKTDQLERNQQQQHQVQKQHVRCCNEVVLSVSWCNGAVQCWDAAAQPGSTVAVQGSNWCTTAQLPGHQVCQLHPKRRGPAAFPRAGASNALSCETGFPKQLTGSRGRGCGSHAHAAQSQGQCCRSQHRYRCRVLCCCTLAPLCRCFAELAAAAAAAASPRHAPSMGSMQVCCGCLVFCALWCVSCWPQPFLCAAFAGVCAAAAMQGKACQDSMRTGDRGKSRGVDSCSVRVSCTLHLAC